MSDFWFTKSTSRILKEHFNIDPDVELIKILDDLVETHNIDAWYMIDGFTNDQIKFVYNNIGFKTFNKNDILRFFDLTKNHSSKKLIAQEWIKTKNLEESINNNKVVEFDASILNQFDGMVSETKQINWCVGQVMKLHPKKYSPEQIKNAINERWFSK